MVRRVPLGADGAPVGSAGRTLVGAAYAAKDTALGRLVATLSRAEDLSHVLLWSAEGARGESSLSVERVELPRLRLAFEARRWRDGKTRLTSVEHPGLALGMPSCERLNGLLRGMPHALVLFSEDGDTFLLLSALAKPCRLHDPAEALNTQLLVARSAPGWEEAMTGVRHYLYPVHPSRTYMTPPSLSAAIALLVLRWLARDYASAFALCAACATDTPPTPEEAQLWALLSDFEDDYEPGSHAVRLKLWLATRNGAELHCPWEVREQLPLYLAKLAYIAADCQLSAAEEMLILRAVGDESMPGAANRLAFLETALRAESADNASADAANPFGGRVSEGGGATLQCRYPKPPKPMVSESDNFDTRLEHTHLLEGIIDKITDKIRGNAWQTRMGSLTYTRPEPEKDKNTGNTHDPSGLAAMGLLTQWMQQGVKLDSDHKGFWLLYELFTGSLNVRSQLDGAPTSHAMTCGWQPPSRFAS